MSVPAPSGAFISEPQSLWGYSCCGTGLSTVTVALRCSCSSVALPTATAPSGINLFHHSLTHSCSHSRGIPAVLWDYPWPHTFRCSSMDLSTGTAVSVSACCSRVTLGLHPFTGIPAAARATAASTLLLPHGSIHGSGPFD